MPRPLPTRDRTTRRLVLHPFRRRDAEPLVRAVHDSLDDLTRWLPWAHRGYGRGDAIRFIRDSGAAWTEGRAFDFAIRSPEQPKAHLGNVSVWHTSRREQAGEIGYWVRTDLSGEGIGTEVTARALQIGFEELEYHKIILRIAAGNERSDKIAKRLGFNYDGMLRHEVRVGDEWLDHSVWSVLETEWPGIKSQLLSDGVLVEK